MQIFSKIYPWRRYWYPRDLKLRLTAAGWPPIPEENESPFFPTALVRFWQIEHILCLVLLGEPGSGKSTWLEADGDEIEERIRSQGAVILSINLRDCTSADDVRKAIFDSREFSRWTEGRYRLHLFLDSLDQLAFKVRGSPTRLVRELEQYPVERLCLRILCRAAEWPDGLEDRLRELYEEELVPGRVQIYRLAPLTKLDVTEAAAGEGVSDPGAFLDEIEARNLVPLAFRPRTLGYLIRAHREAAGLPRNQVELYKTGCRLLCDEPNQDRRDEKRLGNLGVEERLALASRIAALTLLCNRDRVWIGPEGSCPSDGTLTLSDISRGMERAAGRDLSVTDDAVRETLETALFTLRGQNVRGWDHQTDCEFLAADYLCNRGVSLRQIIDLITSGGDPRGRAILQLKQLASWLAVMRSDVLDEIVRRDPEVLLLRDLEAQTDDDRHALRARVTESLLRLLDEGKMIDYNLWLAHDLGSLSYPGLEAQLRPYISDRGKKYIVRRVAVEIAEANGISSVQDILCSVALDRTEDYLVRVSATRALRAIGDDSTKKNLSPLARGESADDPEDELKGLALMALWPDYIPAEELFKILTPPKNDSFFGAYLATFLDHILVERMEACHLVPALQWVQREGTRPHALDCFARLADSIMVRAWTDFDFPGVQEEFARAALTRLRNHDDIVPAPYSDPRKNVLLHDDTKRRTLIATVLALHASSDEPGRFPAGHLCELLTDQDLPCLLGELEDAGDDESRRIFSFWIRRVFDPTDQAQFEAVYPVMERSHDLQEALIPTLGPIWLESPEADRMRADHQERLQAEEATRRRLDREAIRESQTQSLHSRMEAVGLLLNRIEGGELDKFGDLVAAMFGKAAGYIPYEEEVKSLTESDVWKEANSEIRMRILFATRKYVTDGDPEAERWFGTGPPTFFRALLGYVALSFLHEEGTDELRHMPPEVWKKWAPVLLSMPLNADDCPLVHLLKYAYSRVPEDVLSRAMQVLDLENEQKKHPYILQYLEHCWDESIESALVKKLETGILHPKCVRALLERLLDHGAHGARSFAECLLKTPIPSGGDERTQALVAARALFTHASDCGWSAVWPVIDADRDFGRALIEILANEIGLERREIHDRLTEPQLADLYIWMAREYPPSEDPQSVSFRQGGVRVSIKFWRDFVLMRLSDRGTIESVMAIRRIMDELPDLSEDLEWRLHMAQDRANAVSWRPLLPEEVLDLVDDPDKRLVKSSGQLLEVVLESLERYQEKYRRRHDLVNSVWNIEYKQQKLVRAQPREEPALSDALKGHLEDDLRGRGILVNREVEIKPLAPTDLLIEVKRQGTKITEEHYSVVIEVKGCWNPHLESDMDTQLAGRYLKETNCRHGLYVVGWFHCDEWDKDDRRRSKPNKRICAMKAKDAQAMFEQQARTLSNQASGLTIRAMVLDTSFW